MASPAGLLGSTLSPGQISSTETACVPVIDLGCLHHLYMSRAIAVEELGRACQKLGCFQVKNHGINQSVIKGALEAASEFFKTSDEEKAELASEDVKKPVRYDSGSKEGSNDNTRAFLKQYANPIREWIGLWPHNPPNYRERMAAYATEVRRVALQLMDAILESLGLGQEYMTEKLDEGMQVLALNHYHRQQGSQQLQPLIVLEAHTDYGYLTIIAQNCQGLQIIDRNVDDWRTIPEDPETLHVHIGDYLEVLSNGRYKSLVHRAVISTDRRVSIASFHSLSMDEKVSVAVELVDRQHPKRYRDSSFRDFLDYISATHGTIDRSSSFIDSLKVADG